MSPCKFIFISVISLDQFVASQPSLKRSKLIVPELPIPNLPLVAVPDERFPVLFGPPLDRIGLLTVPKLSVGMPIQSHDSVYRVAGMVGPSSGQLPASLEAREIGQACSDKSDRKSSGQRAARKRKRCGEVGCDKIAVSGGKCGTHGGTKRCDEEGCDKLSREKNGK